MSTAKSYRQVERAPLAAVVSAASYVSREWGDDYTIGLAAHVGPVSLASGAFYAGLYVFQVGCWDGSRFVVAADRWGSVPELTDVERRDLALLADVEVN